MFQKNYDTFTYQNEDTFNLSEEMYDYIGSENIKKIKTLAPPMQEATINLYKDCKEVGIHFEIVRGKATYEEQKKLYDEWAPIYGVDKTGVPGTTKHEAGLAIDIKVDNNLSDSIKYNKIAAIWKKNGGYWGGDDIGEYWHFQWGEG